MGRVGLMGAPTRRALKFYHVLGSCYPLGWALPHMDRIYVYGALYTVVYACSSV
jgi:hypothetical protein